jgi:hypothetical protein
VLLEARHQVRALHAVGIGGPVVDVGRGHQLSARRETGDEDRMQVRARGVHRRRVPGGAGAEDEETAVLGGLFGHCGVASAFVRGGRDYTGGRRGAGAALPEVELKFRL